MKNKTIISFSYLLKNKVISKAPVPYIGQYGPIKKPLAVNFFALTETSVTSINQPINEYSIKSKNIILTSIFITSLSLAGFAFYSK